ncbi:MAG TPA: GvpL/GvpF family gas vesicle protein [Solirubrobacteraceae bacterium]|nr:GvpL/GvpF family gas vesicle protein [Solirubrobacteraceae bacterium]
MSAAAPERTYVYGVLGADAPSPHGAGIGGAPLRRVASDGLAALVSALGDDALMLGREEILTHARVLEAAVEHATVLPMRFGVVMEGEPAVKERLLDAHGKELARQLDELAGKVELRVRATYEEEALMREVVGEDGEIARLRQALTGRPEDASYYARIRLGELVAGAIERRRATDTAAIFETLAPLALDARRGESSHERMAFSGSFLVDRERMGAFDAMVDAFGQAQAGRMRIKYTGPLPPHSFVELHGEA